MVAALAIAFVGCSKQDPVDQAVEILHNSAKELKEASNAEEARKVVDETSKEIKKLDIGKADLTKEQQAKLTQALIEYMQAAMSSKIDFTGDEGNNLMDLSSEGHPAAESDRDTGK